MGKLEHLHESCLSVPASYCQQIKEIPSSLKESFSLAHSNKKLQESGNVTKLQKVVEAFINESDNDDDKNVFKNVLENLKNEKASPAKLWKFPVSRFGNVNGNGRVYPRELWENVIDNQQDVWKNGCGLADHPSDDDDPGQFKTSAIVWLDMQIDDVNKLIWAVGTFVGPYGNLAQDIIEHGGRIGFSSSGFGETMGDGQTINPDTYQIERVADIVTNPSQKVFGDIKSNNLSVDYTSQQPVHESVARSEIIKEKNMKIDILKEGSVQQPQQTAPVNTAAQPQSQIAPQAQQQQVAAQTTQQQQAVKESLSKLESKAIEKYVEKLSLDAENIKKPTDKLKEVNELLETVQNGVNEDLRKKVEAQLIKAKDELENMVEGAVNLQDSFGEKDLTKLGEKVKRVAKQGQMLSEQVQDYQALAEGLTARNRELAKKITLLETKLSMRDKISKSTELRHNQKSVSDSVQFDAMNEELNDALKENKELKEQTDSLNKTNRKMESKLSAYEKRLIESGKKMAAMQQTIKESIASSGTDSAKLREAVDQNKTYEGMILRLQASNKKFREQAEQTSDEFKQYKESENPINHLEKAPETYIHDTMNFRENGGVEVEAFWNGLVEKYGESVKPYETQIRGAKTYRESFNNFLKNRNIIVESFKEGYNAALTPNILNKNERKEYLKEAGMDFTNNESSVDEINKAEYENMKKMGFN